MFKLTNLRGNLFGGITAAIVALPLALAFGVVSGMGAQAGLYGAICCGFIAALSGGTPTQISGPTGPMAVVLATTATQFPSQPEILLTVVSLAGLIQILFGTCGFGRYIKLVPQPVISGFMSGIGVTVILLQISPFLGHTAPDGSVLLKISALPQHFSNPEWQAVIVGCLSFAIVSLTPRRIALLVPPALTAIIVGVLVAAFWLPKAPVIGAIPSGLPGFHSPTFTLDSLPVLLRSALVLAFLGSIDSLLTSLVADSKTNTQHNSNRELIGQGLGNFVSGLFGGIAGAGASMRTLVNIQAGGTGHLSGMVHALVLLMILLAFSDLASSIPTAVLSGILFKVGLEIIDWRNIRRVVSLPRPGAAIMLTTLLITVFVDLLSAIAVGIVMASVLYVEKQAQAQMETMRFVTGASPELEMDEEESSIMEEADGRIMLFQVEGPLSFASSRDITRAMRHIPEKEVLIINLSKVPFIDSSAAASLEEVTAKLIRHEDHILFCGTRKRVMDTLLKTDVVAMIPKESFMNSRKEALLAARDLLQSDNTQPESADTA